MIEAYGDAFTQVDYTQRQVKVQGREVHLTPLEFKLLSAFVQNPNQVLSRDQLLELVWGDPYGVSGDQVKLYVGYLRRSSSRTPRRQPRSRRCGGSATGTGAPDRRVPPGKHFVKRVGAALQHLYTPPTIP